MELQISGRRMYHPFRTNIQPLAKSPHQKLLRVVCQTARNLILLFIELRLAGWQIRVRRQRGQSLCRVKRSRHPRIVQRRQLIFSTAEILLRICQRAVQLKREPIALCQKGAQTENAFV